MQNGVRKANLLPVFYMTVKEHYDKHLGKFYSWMAGDFNTKQLEHQDILRSFNIAPSQNGRAIDLGAGHGIQSIALAALGFDVIAVDFNEQVLSELRSKGKLSIEIISDEILNYLRQTKTEAEIMVCMGDTLTHLESVHQVEALFSEMFQHLLPGGKVVLSF